MSDARSAEFRPFQSAEARDRYLAHYESREKSWPIAFESRIVHTDHGTTFVRVSGPDDAPALVLLPGGQSSSLVWQRLIEPLSARFRSYALDAIFDAGRSLPARPMKDVADLTSWLDGVLDELGLSDGISMMGVSYGAYVTAEYALHAPQRLSKVVWLSPVMVAAPISQEFVERLKPCVDPGRGPLEAFSRWIMPGLAAADEQEFQKRVDELLLIRESRGTMVPPVGRLAFSDEELAGIEVPALYIVGECDGATDDPPNVVAHINAALPRIATMLVPDAGHDAMVSHPGIIADRVLQFLDRAT